MFNKIKRYIEDGLGYAEIYAALYDVPKYRYFTDIIKDRVSRVF